MIYWCIVIIFLGSWGLVRDIFAIEVPGLLNPIANSAIMLVALGLLIRIRGKQKAGVVEKLVSRIEKLESEIGSKGSAEK